MVNEDWPRNWLREKLGYESRDTALFAAALTHRSATRPHYERLEFLGDAVLNLLLAERLFESYPSADEGDLSRLRARLVSSEPLAEIAAELRIGEVLRLGSGELKSGGFRRRSILADAFEALCGALYLDGGLEAVRRVTNALFAARIAQLPEPASLKDAKTRLQEYLQSRGLPLPSYQVERTEGEPHEQTFWVLCEVRALQLRAQGSGSSRRRAEQQAAERVLEEIEANDQE
ncbi:MAG TPA: ribonuclease III [Steroidobacteraceae bacterium]|nr:ribonuclease III [Steroidobacteraceae bacterium]